MSAPRARPRRRRRPSRRPTLALAALAGALALTLAVSGTASAHPANRERHDNEAAGSSPRVAVGFSCTAVTFNFNGFRADKENTVTETIKADGTRVYKGKFTFYGESGTNTVTVQLPAGQHLVKAGIEWKTNGLIGETGVKREKVNCAAASPTFAVEKLQTIAGSGAPATADPLTGKGGQTVLYEILVSNTGNVPLIVTSFSDPNCDPGTLAGGQGEAPLAPSASTLYTCSHVLGEGGSYSNTATVTAHPQEGGAAKTQPSNTVTVSIPEKPSFEIIELQEVAGSGAGYTTATLSATIGQTVDYEIVLKNTGNTTIAFNEFTDIFCDSGTLSGGPAGALAPGASAIYKCSHRLTETGNYLNIASVHGDTAGHWEKTLASNTVTVKTSSATTGNTAPGGGSGSSGSGGGSGSSSGSGSAGSAGNPTGSSGVLPSKTAHKAAKKKRARHTSTSHRTPRFTG